MKIVLTTAAAALSSIFLVAVANSEPQSLVECSNTGCYPRYLTSTNAMERDPVVQQYAAENRCDEMHGVALRGCENLMWDRTR